MDEPADPGAPSMQALSEHLDLDRFFDDLARARERVLLLDYDGTLAPFHRNPRLALPYPGIARLLGEVARRGGTRIVLVSGRRLEDLRLALALLPHAEAWASHGWEHLTSTGSRITHAPLAAARRALDEAERRAGTHVPGERMERKVASVAIHWRGLKEPDANRLQDQILACWTELAGEELQLLPFDGGMEIRVRGRDKGEAVREAVGACARDAVCAYLGDDLTDEDAFRAVHEHDGGLGVLVRPKPRPTAARLWLSPPRELALFLDRWRAAEAPA